jgi:hypothetical protein
MARAKRMSDIFASSAENGASAEFTTATPPYSSEGPTLPLIEGDGEHAAGINANGPEPDVQNEKGDATKQKKSQAQAQPTTTNHPALYEPWTLLPRELLGPLLSQSRLADAQNVVPLVFTKNQNIKSGIIRLKTYMGAHVDKKNPIEIPEALKEKGSIIALSAQGEGTAKLVTIVDMAKRVVSPAATTPDDDKAVEKWWMYMSLASIDLEQRKKTTPKESAQVDDGQVSETQEEELFEPMDIDAPHQEKPQDTKTTRKVPVLTFWMTRKRIPAFKEAFGEQTFTVQTLPKEE